MLKLHCHIIVGVGMLLCTRYIVPLSEYYFPFVFSFDMENYAIIYIHIYKEEPNSRAN